MGPGHGTERERAVDNEPGKTNLDFFDFCTPQNRSNIHVLRCGIYTVESGMIDLLRFFNQKLKSSMA